MEIAGVPENRIFLISGRLRRSPDVFLAVFGAQLRKFGQASDLVLAAPWSNRSCRVAEYLFKLYLYVHVAIFVIVICSCSCGSGFCD